jgi:radical SAM protein with 4Fe4S-binding SPASM domain
MEQKDYSKTLPWCVKLETVEGCNRECNFCPVPLIYGKRYSFMEIETAKKIAKQLYDWSPNRSWRFEFAMLGEPMLNKNLYDIVKAVRQVIVKAQITIITNGDVIMSKYGKDDLINKLFDSGANVIGIDCYDKKSLDFFNSNLKKPDNIYNVYDYFKDKYPLYATKKGAYKLKDVVVIDDISTNQNVKTVRKLHNFGGNVDNSVYGVSNKTLNAGCEKPFRDLVVSHKGEVLLCCLDANKDAKIGSINEFNLKDLWYSENYNNIRKQLSNKERVGKPCINCSFFGGHKRFIAQKDWQKFIV